MAPRNAIVWFRNDLRLRDNALLHLKQVTQASAVVGVYCFDERFENKFIRAFREQAIANLRRSFKDKFGVPLLVFRGKPERILPALAERIEGDGTIVCSTEVTSYETRIDDKVRRALDPLRWKLETTWTYSLYHPDDLDFDVLQGVLAEPFTVFRKQVESSKVPVRHPLIVPFWGDVREPELKPGREALDRVQGFVDESTSLGWEDPNFASFETAFAETPDHLLGVAEAAQQDDDGLPRQALQFRGGEDAAHLRLEQFCECGLSTYKATRNSTIGWNYSSKLSPWLTAGCLSPRQVHHRIAQYEALHGETVHTYWVTFELMWRDYMRFFAIKHGNAIFFEAGPAGELPKDVSWSYDATAAKRFEAWKLGLTGVPWVDGHMRELAKTGFMSNRGRQNVASFLVHNLNVDWRLGAKHFQDLLIDHDVTANWCNWVMAAGVGFKSQRVNRFNMDKQARDYDPKGEHARMWIPELNVPQGQCPHDLALRPPIKANTLDRWFSASATNAEEIEAAAVKADQALRNEETKGDSSSGDDEASRRSISKRRRAPYPLPIVKVNQTKMDPAKFKRNKRAHQGKGKTFLTH